MGWIADYDHYHLAATSPRWNADRTYTRGEVVSGKVDINRGTLGRKKPLWVAALYRARKKNQGIEPHTDPGTWHYL